MATGYDLLAVYREAADLAADERAIPPQACPNDGTPLSEAPDGTLQCRFDGYTWPRDGRG
jgi:hypothetical protein